MNKTPPTWRGRRHGRALLLALACTLALRADVTGETTTAPEGTVCGGALSSFSFGDNLLALFCLTRMHGDAADANHARRACRLARLHHLIRTLPFHPPAATDTTRYIIAGAGVRKCPPGSRNVRDSAECAAASQTLEKPCLTCSGAIEYDDAKSEPGGDMCVTSFIGISKMHSSTSIMENGRLICDNGTFARTAAAHHQPVVRFPAGGG